MQMATLLLLVIASADPTEIPLWPGKVPGPTSPDANQRPSLTVYLAAPERACGTAVVVCPGGGYSIRAVDHEGRQIAAWLNARGIHAFVLKYRTVDEAKIKPPLDPAPMLDVQRALRLVRSWAEKHAIDAQRIGVWGFSAGGHLAGTAAVHFDQGRREASDPVERFSSRPDFAILAYPVISMDPAVTHAGSRRNLLGTDPDPKRAEFYSLEKQVTSQTPPTFLFHTREDQAVKVRNSELFHEALKKQGVETELFIVEKGRHGVGLGQDALTAKAAPEVAAWPERLEAWLRSRKLIR